MSIRHKVRQIWQPHGIVFGLKYVKLLRNWTKLFLQEYLFKWSSFCTDHLYFITEV
jgi:hypothetical protein